MSLLMGIPYGYFAIGSVAAVLLAAFVSSSVRSSTKSEGHKFARQFSDVRVGAQSDDADETDEAVTRAFYLGMKFLELQWKNAVWRFLMFSSALFVAAVAAFFFTACISPASLPNGAIIDLVSEIQRQPLLAIASGAATTSLTLTFLALYGYPRLLAPTSRKRKRRGQRDGEHGD